MTAPASLLLLCTLLLLAFLFCQYGAKGKGALHFTGCTNDNARKANILLHAVGVLLLGLVPGMTVDPAYYIYGLGTLKAPFGKVVLITFLLSIPAAILAVREAKKMSPAANHTIFNAPYLLYLYFPLRTLYITAYEFFFRGVLLFSCLQILNVFWAIFLNTVFYFIAHLMGDKKEKLGTVLMGPLLCMACLSASSFWPAVTIHLTLTLFYEINFIRFTRHSTKH